MLVGVVTMKSRPWELEENYRRLEHWARAAAERRAEVVIAPESVLDGYVFNADPTSTREGMMEIAQRVPDGPYLVRARELSRELGIYLTFGFLERSGADLFNSCVMADPRGEIIAHYRKVTTAGEYEITPGGALEPFDTPLGRVGFLLCSDRGADNCRTLAVQGAGIIFIPMDGSGGPDNTEKMRWRARENGCWIIIANTWSAVIIGPGGELYLEKYETECISVQIVGPVKSNRTPFRARRTDLYEPLAASTEEERLYDQEGRRTPRGREQMEAARRKALASLERPGP